MADNFNELKFCKLSKLFSLVINGYTTEFQKVRNGFYHNMEFVLEAYYIILCLAKY